ncbi:flavin monoamine oxidase family protein [Nocardia sp. NPDC052566]|uniref:flavin monoamine oxidase family protein n=1 Tax=Nocardia sp. NPDC052566 TaxID=3364330 RepID=UPI0037C6429C
MDEFDVVVVGAGLSGLVAARRLWQRGIRRIVVFEAAKRVGGRVVNQRVDADTIVEGGGQWAGPSQDRVLALARELGVPTFPSYFQGRSVLVLGGKRRTYRSDVPYTFPLIALDQMRALARLDAMSRRIDVERPWAAENAAELDKQTLDEFFRRQLRTNGARQILDVISGLTFGGDPADISLLGVLTHIRSADGLGKLLDMRGGAQELRFAGGSQRLALRMAEELGATVELGHVVTHIETTAESARVRTRDRVVQARRVIVALSPADRRAIEFHPPLPPALAEATRRITTHTGLKTHAVYRRPFWRAAGLSGQAMGLGPARWVVDNSPPDAHLGILTAFVASTGPVAPTEPQLTDHALRKAAIIDCLAHYFGPEAHHPIDYLEQDWRTEPFTAGCIPTVPPGLLTGLGAEATAHYGPIIWAGAEQSHVWNAYMDGAVRAGERAATLALNLLT